jgi:hypothetical protein
VRIDGTDHENSALGISSFGESISDFMSYIQVTVSAQYKYPTTAFHSRLHYELRYFPKALFADRL